MIPTGVRPSRMVQTVFLFPLTAPSAGKNKGADPRMAQTFTSGGFQCRAQYPAESKGIPWEQDRDFPCSAVSADPGGWGPHHRGAGGCKPHLDSKVPETSDASAYSGSTVQKVRGGGTCMTHSPKEGRAAATLVMHYHGNMFCPFWIKGRTSLKSALQCFPSLSLKSPSIPPTP